MTFPNPTKVDPFKPQYNTHGSSLLSVRDPLKREQHTPSDAKIAVATTATFKEMSAPSWVADCQKQKNDLEILLKQLTILKVPCNPGAEDTRDVKKVAFESAISSELIKRKALKAIQDGIPYKTIRAEDLHGKEDLLWQVRNEDGRTLFSQIESDITAQLNLCEQALVQLQTGSSTPLDPSIELHRLRSDPYQVFQCPAHYTLEVASLEIAEKQIQKIESLLREGKNTQALQIIDLLDDKSLLSPLGHLIWELDGRNDSGDFNYGFNALKKNPQRLLHIKTSNQEDGKNILQQILAHISLQKNNQLKLHLVSELQRNLKAENNEQAYFILSVIQQHFPSSYGSLCYKIYETHNKDPNLQEAIKADSQYGEHKLQDNPQTLLQGSPSIIEALISEIEQQPTENILMRMVYRNSHETTAERIQHITNEGKGLKVAMVTAELRGIVSEGGLGEAVLGMAKGLNESGTSIQIIMPKYADKALPEPIRHKLAEAAEKGMVEQITALSADGAQKIHNVYEISIGDQAPQLSVLMIEDPIYFDQNSNPGGKNISIYGSMERFVQFQKLAKELCHKLYQERKVDVIHLQDSQTALIPTLFKHDALQEEIDPPPVVFTFHNNGYSAQCCYEDTKVDHPQQILNSMGLGFDKRNFFVEGIMNADAVTTVSSQFAQEAMFSEELQRGVGHVVRQAAYQGRFFDVLNGIDSSNWNPKTNTVLKSWICVETLDFIGDAETLSIDPSEFNSLSPAAAQEKAQAFIVHVTDRLSTARAPIKIDLSYGKEDHPLYIAMKKELCKRQVAAYLQKFNLGSIDPQKPLFLNIGRFDASQKGTDKLPLLMDLIKKEDAQLISIGLDGSTCPDRHAMVDKQLQYESNGIIVILDERVGGKIKWQVGHTDTSGKQIPGFGPLLRAAADVGVFPSEFEPCGLVQGEAFMMGCRALTTDTGGFHDTVFTDGDRKNGWRFKRAAQWRSPQQELEIQKVVPEVIAEIKGALYSENLEKKIAFYEQTKKVMANAELMDWNKKHESDAMTPVEKLQAIYAFAMKKSLRGYEPFTL